MSISKFVVMSLLGASVGIASANLGIASANAATITNNFVFTGEANNVVASGSFSFDSSLTGTIGYSNLSAFSITLVGQSYDLAFVNALNPAPPVSDYVYFGYDISANTFVPASVPGSVGNLTSILAGTDLYVGFFFSPLLGQGDDNADGAYTEYRTETDGFAVAFTISSAIPEPSTWIMMILGFLGLAGLAYRRRERTALGAVQSARLY
jgi:hypothetical protein